MTADVLVIPEARVHDGAKDAPLPITIVHAACRDVFRLGVTDLTLILCDYLFRKNQHKLTSF